MPCFKVMALRKRAHNFVFSKGKVCSQIVANVNVKRFHIVTLSTAVSFSVKTFFFMKLTTYAIDKRDI